VDCNSKSSRDASCYDVVSEIGQLDQIQSAAAYQVKDGQIHVTLLQSYQLHMYIYIDSRNFKSQILGQYLRRF
jgi:hypothetical protein